MLITIITENQFDWSFVLAPIAFLVMFLPLTLIFALIPINIVFCFAYLLDILLSVPLRFLGWRLSIGLFITLLAATILLAVYPVAATIISIVRR